MTSGGVVPRAQDFNFAQWARLDVPDDLDLSLGNWTSTDGTPIYAPVDSRHPGWQRFTNWNDLGPYGKQLRARQTKIVYLSPDGSRLWNLAGDWGGREGVVLDEKLSGTMHPPAQQRYSGGPYMLGEELERTDYGKRVIHGGVIVGPGVNYLSRRRFPDTPFAYRMLEEKWWGDWPENKNSPAGFWGTFTRTHGWRWTRVRNSGENTDMVLEIDPVAYGNNCQAWPMTIHSEFPFYSKRAFTAEWINDAANAQINGKNHGVLDVACKGDWPQWPKFIVEGAGEVSIQDGVLDRMVPLPEIYASDGLVLVDTDPAKRTLTGSKDPVDTLFYQIIRNSEILDYLLGDLTNADSGLPVGRRMPGGIGFTSQIPPKSVAHIKVTHSNPAGKITAVVPQWYKMGYA